MPLGFQGQVIAHKRALGAVVPLAAGLVVIVAGAHAQRSGGNDKALVAISDVLGR